MRRELRQIAAARQGIIAGNHLEARPPGAWLLDIANLAQGVDDKRLSQRAKAAYSPPNESARPKPFKVLKWLGAGQEPPAL